MKVKKYNKTAKLLIFILVLTICVALPCIAYADAPDITGVIHQANSDLETTLNPVPKAVLPIFELVIAVLALFKLASLTKEYVEHKNDDREAKEITSKIHKVIAIAIAIAVGAPLLIMFVNTLFGTNLSV